MKNNGFLALCSEQGYVDIPWESPPNGLFSIVMQWMPDTTSAQGGLFSLGNIFSLELSEGRLSLKVGNTCSLSKESVALRRTNTVAAVYDGVKLIVCLNGLGVIETNATDMTASSWRIGENLKEACILRLSVYHEALSPTDICKSVVNKHLACHKRIDFTGKEIPADASFYQAEIKNHVYALNCSEGSFSMASAVLPKEYTISLSVYLREDSAEDVLLLRTPNMSIRLCDVYGIGERYIVISRPTHGVEQRYQSPYVVDTGKWITLTFAFGNARGQVYFDDKFIMDFPCDTIAEKGEIVLGSFAGSLGVFAIAKSAIPEKEISAFLNRQFGALDSGLLYLADFSENAKRTQWMEECHDKELQSNGGKIMLLRDSNAPLRTNNDRPGPISERRYSDFVNWQIGILLYLLVEWLHTQLGIYPNRGNIDRSCNPWKIDENLHLFIHRDILSMDEAQLLLYHYDSIKSEDLQALILAMKENGTLEKLIAYLYQEDKDQNPIDEILYWLVAAALVAAAIALMLPKPGTFPPPPKAPQKPDIDDPDDDDDKKKKKTYVTIKQTLLKGDLKITGCGESFSGDADAEDTAVFYKGGFESTGRGLQVTLSFRGEKGAFTIYGENEGGKIIPDVTKQVSYQGSSQIELSLDVKPERFTERYGMCAETIKWRCESRDSENKQIIYLGETKFDIYFLAGKPCAPWSKSVNIECLKLCADCAESAKGSSQGFFRDYMRYIQKDAGKGKTHYHKGASRQGEPWQFDADRFAHDWRNAERRRNISAESRSISGVIFGALNGEERALVILSSDIYYKRREEDDNRIYAHLLEHSVDEIDGFRCPEGIEQYLPANENGIYDADTGEYLPFTDNEKRTVTGPADNGHYREKKYSPGSACRIVGRITGWCLGNAAAEEASASAFGWVAPGADGRYKHIGRAPFIPAVEAEISRQPAHDGFNAVCHSVSACEIDEIIADICNGPQADLERRLELLTQALYPFGEENAFTGLYYQITNRLRQTLARCMRNGNDYRNDVLLHFCYLASNSPANLRKGNQVWNGIVGSDFDPTGWFYYYRGLDCVISDWGYDEALGDRNLVTVLRNRYREQLPGQGFDELPAWDENQWGFYLPSRADGIRITCLLRLNAPVCLQYRMIQDYGNNARIYFVLHSSSNRFANERPVLAERYVQSAAMPSEQSQGPLPLSMPLYYRSAEQKDGWKKLVI